MRRSTGTLVVGATFTGLGYLAAHPRESLLLERGIHAGYEFITAMRSGTDWDKPVISEPGRELLREFENRGIISPPRLPLIFAMMPVLFGWIRQSGLRLILSADLISVSKKSGGFLVTACDGSGNFMIECEKILDTTGGAQACSEFRHKIAAKSLRALLECGGEDNRSFHMGEISVHRGPAENFCFLHFPVKAGDVWAEARQHLYDYWLSRPRELENYTLAAAAERFIYKYSGDSVQSSGGKLWMPSCGFKNPLLACDAGAMIGEGAWLK